MFQSVVVTVEGRAKLPKDVPVPISETWEYTTLQGKDELRYQMELRLPHSQPNNSEIPWTTWVGPMCSQGCLKAEKGGKGGDQIDALKTEESGYDPSNKHSFQKLEKARQQISPQNL